MKAALLKFLLVLIARPLLGRDWKAKLAAGPCDHEWAVVSTVLSEVSLQTMCRKCGLYGTVPEPSKEEWTRAFDAPSNPYAWDEPERVRTNARNGVEVALKTAKRNDAEA